VSKIGAHVVQGGRNGYGPLCEARPAVVVAADEGGALLEAKEKSGGHTITVFRDTTIYADAPHGIDQMNPEQARSLADALWPQLLAKWRLNPADYYTALNEPAGNDLMVMPSYLAYELRIMERAEAEGLKLCVLNLATGTPDDGRVAGGVSNSGIETWKQVYVPHIQRAFAGGHVYGRHLYDQAGVERLGIEADYLRGIGLTGGIIATEAGLNGGYGYVGDVAWTAWAQSLDLVLRDYALVIGAALWTLGEWNGANWQSSVPAMTAYLAANPTPKWGPPEPLPPPDDGGCRGKPRTQYQRYYAVIPANATLDQAVEIFKQNWATSKRTVGGSYDDGGLGDLDTREVALYGIPAAQRAEFSAWYNGHYPGVFVHFFNMDGTPAQLSFAFEAWPTNEKRVTQKFGANPGYYSQFGLPGHEGVDIAAALNSPIYAVAAGTVYLATANVGNYGIQVRIDHGNGWKTVYAHNASLLVKVGDKVAAGQQIAKADNTGNSSGSHLHLTLKRDGQPTPGWPADIVDPTPFLMPFNPTWPGDTQPTPATVDLLPFFRGNGVLYEVRTVSGAQTGAQERFQTQLGGGTWFYQTKNTQWEEFYYDNDYIWRRRDTSPGPAPSYAMRPGQMRWYSQKETGKEGARWCKRHMSVGETFVGPGHHVQFYYKSDCAPDSANSGTAYNRVTFLALYKAGEWRGMPFRVIAVGDPAGEIMYFGEGYGLVGWKSSWGESYLSEIHAPGTRPNNAREILPC
jgi:murein DD-endopeptidase MepM/ murein hydrolase activator NlpD